MYHDLSSLGMSIPSCVPEDRFNVVLRCDATGAVQPIGCNYVKKIGTTFGTELSESASVSTTIGNIGMWNPLTWSIEVQDCCNQN